MRPPVIWLVAAMAVVGSTHTLMAQDLKKGVTELAHVDADFHIQGEYSGNVTHPDGWYRAVGLQVVALGDGKFDALWSRGGLPGNGYDGSTRIKLSGQRTGDKTVLAGEGWTVELQPGYAASVKSTGGVIVGHLSPLHRYSLTAGAVPPTNALVLFDGKNTDRLKNAKITADGLLEIGCETKEPVQNFTLHAEFRTPYMPYARGQARGNSGFYLQKRYEVQVLDSFGLELQFNDCASLYRFKAPDLNMSFPPLSWQTYDIDFTAPKFDADGQRIAQGRITVRHNGVVVHNNVELENKTGGGSVEGPNPQPILFQNHSNPVHFRNVWLVDHDATTTRAQPACTSTSTFAAGCGGTTIPVCCVPEMKCRSPRLKRCR